MNTKQLILKQVKNKGFVRSADIVHLAKISRQGAAKHLRELIKAKRLLKEGSTHNARYILFSPSKAENPFKVDAFSSFFHIKGLDEDKVFQNIAQNLNLRKRLSSQAFKNMNYAFTEMLNNAIEHSRASRVSVQVILHDDNVGFTIVDRGIGIFENIKRKFKLKNHWDAVEHLLKGKQTTDPKHHTGQGIFFTSRIADRFILQSANLKLEVNNLINDNSIEEIKFFKGTHVGFLIKKASRRDLKQLFDRFSNQNYEYDKTEVKIKLSRSQGFFVSRSEAKRVLFGLEKFKRIIVDFQGVSTIGQGFADQIFRVFQSSYPDIAIIPVNAVPAVEHQIKKAKT